NPEELDYIIVGQNFGDVKYGSNQTDQVPSLAARIKHKLKIKNPYCVTYDVIFGCPGWLEGVIQAQAFIRAGMAKKCLVIGARAITRGVEPHDKDSMIFTEGAGATIIEANNDSDGILSHLSASYTYQEAPYLNYIASEHPERSLTAIQYVKMSGRRIYN